MLRKVLERQGSNYRRWRIVFVLLLAPFAVYAFIHSGWMSTRLGDLAEQRWDLFCLALAFSGLALRMHMAGYGQVAEAGRLLQEGPLQTEGFYSVVRHPIVFANFLILLSGALLFKSAFFTLLAVIVACLYYERLMLAKEKALERHGDAYSAWVATTPLIIPQFRLWKKPSAEFSFARALHREAITFAFIGLIFFTLETLEGTWIDGLPFMEWVQREPHWLGLVVLSTVILAAQLSRALAIVVFLLSLAGFVFAHVGGVTSSRSNSEDRAIKALKAGGHVLLMRHSFTSGRDQDDLNLNDCATQRNLNGPGRDYARDLGRMLQEDGVRIARTITSQFCRAKETAQLMGHDPDETLANLNEQHTHVTLFERLFGNQEKDERIFRQIRNVVSVWNGKENLLLVSHAPIIASLTYRSLHMGEGLVLKPAPHLALGFTIVGKIPNGLPAARH